ncbi:MFS transporter [Staphylococcus chromogenes]|uniref:MFS transporter n=1 Tax=Staphylococcus chromogenes TaxID=46126 RepID=UPI00188FBDE2|nr:MFS transporter [Staphylococcus chromogenes]
MFKILTNYNFKNLLFGRLLVNMGDSIYYIAAMWLVYQLGDSVTFTGIAGFLMLLPEIFSFLVGPLIEKMEYKKILIVSSLGQGILISIIPLVYFLGFINIPIVLIILFLVAILNMFIYPVENTIVPNIVKKESLVQANSMMSFSYQSMNLIFNSLTGILILSIGISSVFLVSSLSFFIAIYMYSKLHINFQNINKMGHDISMALYYKQLKEGFTFVLRHKIINKILFPILLINLIFSAVIVVFPEYASTIGGSEYYGVLLTLYSGGLIIGTIISDYLTRYIQLGYLFVLGFLISGIFWILFAYITEFSVFIGFTCLLIAAIPIGFANVFLNSYMQNILPQKMLVRVSTILESIYSVAMPLGSLLGGYLGSLLGTDIFLFVNGFIILGISLYWLIIPKLRTIKL